MFAFYVVGIFVTGLIFIAGFEPGSEKRPDGKLMIGIAFAWPIVLIIYTLRAIEHVFKETKSLEYSAVGLCAIAILYYQPDDWE